MDFEKLAYPEIFTIDGIAHIGKRNMAKGQVLIPYTQKPDVGQGDVIAQKSGQREIRLKITEASFVEGGSFGVGTDHPHMLTLSVVNTTAQPHISKKQVSLNTSRSVSDKPKKTVNPASKIANRLDSVADKPREMVNQTPKIENKIPSVPDKPIKIDRPAASIATINILQLVEHVAKSGDAEARSALKSLLQNDSVARLIGAGASALARLL